MRSKKFGKYKRKIRQKRTRKEIMKDAQMEADEFEGLYDNDE